MHSALVMRDRLTQKKSLIALLLPMPPRLLIEHFMPIWRFQIWRTRRSLAIEANFFTALHGAHLWKGEVLFHGLIRRDALRRH